MSRVCETREATMLQHGEYVTILIREATKSGYIEMVNGGVCDLSYPNSANRRGRVQGGG